MTTPRIALIGAALFSVAITTDVAATTIDLPQYGFTIEALDGPPPTTATTALFTFLPMSDGFAPNINVSIHPFSESITDFITLTKDELKKEHNVILTDKQIGENEWLLEAVGPFQGNDLHIYRRVVANGGKMYQVSATAKQSQWDSVSGILRRAVHSFKAK